MIMINQWIQCFEVSFSCRRRDWAPHPSCLELRRIWVLIQPRWPSGWLPPSSARTSAPTGSELTWWDPASKTCKRPYVNQKDPRRGQSCMSGKVAFTSWCVVMIAVSVYLEACWVGRGWNLCQTAPLCWLETVHPLLWQHWRATASLERSIKSTVCVGGRWWACLMEGLHNGSSSSTTALALSPKATHREVCLIAVALGINYLSHKSKERKKKELKEMFKNITIHNWY